MTPFRVYDLQDCGPDGYPHAWHTIDGGPGVKHLVRAAAGHRCIRCSHPYTTGDGEWSRCDEQCTHPTDKCRIIGGHVGPVWSDEFWNGAQVEAQWRVLTVHHLRLGDEHKRDLRWFNLAALCQRCHLSVQTRVQLERVWPWEHSEWFKPYAAAWYALSYLGEDLTREQTIARLDELLDLERVSA